MMIGGEYNYLLDKKTDDPNTKVLSICIPVYKELGYLEHTLAELNKQVMVQNGYVLTVIGEYRDDWHDNSIKKLCDVYPNTKYVPVNRRGIAHARNICVYNSLNPKIGTDNKTIVGAENVPFIMNMDADAYFQHDTGTYYMLLPLLERPDLMLTNCEIIYPADIMAKKEAENKTIYEHIYKFFSEIGTLSERVVTARGPGMTYRRAAFDAVNGYRENRRVGEDYWFAWDICYKYTVAVKEFIENVKIVASDRRVKGANKDGLIKAFSYKTDYRKIIPPAKRLGHADGL